MFEDIYRFQKKYAAEHKVPVMLDESMAILQETVRRARPKKILEIGTAIGYSGIKMLEQADCATLTTVDKDADRLDVARECFKKAGLADRVTIWEGDSDEIVRYASGKFDFIMLDGPKGQYARYLPYLKELLLKGGVLFADDVTFKCKTGEDFNPLHKLRTISVQLKVFLDELTNDKDFETTLYDVGDGISVSVKKG